jgi:hypothetical protein
VSFGPGWQRILRWKPVVACDLRQALRTGRTIFLLVVLAVLLGLLILGIGSAFGMTRAPVNFGFILFQIFFSLAYFIVTILGAAVAAIGLSSEKDGRTWDTLVLTGVDVRTIANGKFWTSAFAVFAFLVMITPASLLSLLLGGVSVVEVVLAFVLLGAIGVVAVAYGISVGAAAHGTGSATLVAMASALVAAPILYVAAGFGMSLLAHATWPEVPSIAPVWLPLAYTRGRFDGWYALLLIALPAGVISLALWFLHELTVARLSTTAEDRISGLKRWYLVALPVVTAIATVPGFMTRGPTRLSAWLGGLGGLFLFLTFSGFVFVGDALAAPRRVEYRWKTRGARWTTRVLGPGLVQTAMLLLVTSLLAFAVYALVGAGVLSRDAAKGAPPAASIALLCTGEYWSAFFVFLVGFLVWARVRADSPSGARVLSTMVAAIALAAPWIAFLTFGYAAAQHLHDTLVIAAPSPLYSFVMVGAIERGEPHLALTSGLLCSLGWISMGFVLFGLGARRATRIVAEQRTLRANLEARIGHRVASDVLPTTDVPREAPRDGAATSEA